MRINVLIVKPDASPVSFQAETWERACNEVFSMAHDLFYGLTMSCQVFMRDVDDQSSYIECHTVKEVCARR
jgi:hypothetical protein